MTSEERISKVKKILEKIRPSNNNLLVLANMTDDDVEQLYNEVFKII